MAITVRELVTKWGFEVDDKDIKRLQKDMDATKKKATDVGKQFRKVGKTLTVAITLPALALGAFFIKAASDAEETSSKFAIVFQDIADDSERAAKRLAKDFGLSSTKSKELLSDTGDLLTGFGFTQKSALDLSVQVNELAVDLASFTNFVGGADGASRALTKALLGERESVKSLGISILEADVKRQVALNRTKGLTFETERQAKALATLQIAQRQSANALGDFARTSGEFANQSRILRGRLNSVAESFGKILLPAATATVEKLIELAEKFEGLDENTKKIILTVVGFAAVIGPLLIIVGALISAVGKIAIAFKFVGGILAGVTAAGLGLAAIWAGLTAAIFLVIQDIVSFFQGADSVTGKIVAAFQKIKAPILAVFNFISELFRNLFSGFSLFFGEAITKFFSPIISVLTRLSQLVKPGVQAAAAALPVIDRTQNAVAFSAALGNRQFNTLPRSVAGGQTQNINVTAPITINVPEGTTPDQVGPSIKEGIRESFDLMMREADRQNRPSVVF